MSAWDNLSIREKAAMMRTAVSNGITNIDDIRREYNEFAEGGPTKKEIEDLFWQNRMDEAQAALNQVPQKAPTPIIDRELPELTVYPQRNYPDPYSIPQGEVTSVTGNALSRAINNYTGELKYDLANNRIPGGKYTLPAAVLGATGIAGLAKAGEMAYATGVTPYIAAGLDALSGYEAINDFNNGQADWGTALAMTPLVGPIARTGVQGAKYSRNIYKALSDPRYRALHAYNSITPSGYDNAFSRGKDWVIDMVKDNPVNLKYPKWYKDLVRNNNGERPVLGYTNTGGYLDPRVLNRGQIGDEARLDAWALYNGLDQQYGTYKKIRDGVYSYDMKNLMKKSEGTWRPHDHLSTPRYNGDHRAFAYDEVTGAGGGLTDSRIVATDDKGNMILHIEDLNDYQPFSRSNSSLESRLKDRMEKSEAARRDAVQKFRVKMFDKGIFGLNQHNPIINKIDDYLNQYRGGYKTIKNSDGTTSLVDNPSPIYRIQNSILNSDAFKQLNKKVKDFEIGTITGGKPFKMETDIPLHYSPRMIPPGTSLEDAAWITAKSPDEILYGFNPDYVSTLSLNPSWRSQQTFDTSILKNVIKDLDLSNLTVATSPTTPSSLTLYQKALGGNLFADGGIHIKPSHRGRLTELKARTGKTEAELYNDGNPAHKKMVVFARNARKWHDLGGTLFPDGGSMNPSVGKAMQYFMNKGLTDYQAAGLVGNLMRESSLDHRAENKSSKAYGLAQWLGDRKTGLFKKYGNNPTFEQQLDYVWDELNSTHKNGLRMLKASKSAEEAARNAMGYYEFSVGPEKAIANMIKHGQDGEGSMRKGVNFAMGIVGQNPVEYVPQMQLPPNYNVLQNWELPAPQYTLDELTASGTMMPAKELPLTTRIPSSGERPNALLDLLAQYQYLDSLLSQ